MKKQFLIILICWGSGFFSLSAQSLLFQEDRSSLGGYIRTSAYGAGSKFDYASTFVEGQLNADITKGFTEGYGFFKAEVRLREGQFFGVNQTQLEIKDLYAGFRNEKFELTLGNQSIQWGRGIGANPTNNLTPTNGFFLTSNGADQNLSNFMIRTKYSINPNLEWEVVGVPMYKASIVRLDLLNLPNGVNPGSQTLPGQKFKNGSIATRLNLNMGPIGGSVSYFNGYNSQPAVVPGATATGLYANLESFHKQTFGVDFGTRIGGHSDGTLDASNDALILSEIGYDKIDNPTNAAWVPQSNLTYTLGMVKMWFDKSKLDKFTIVASYFGKYTPNYITAVAPTDYTDPDFGTKILNFSQRDLTQALFGQQKAITHSMICNVSKTFDKGKYELSAVGMYNFTVTSSMFSPRATWNVTKNLKATAGGFYLFGPGTQVVSPVMNGLFCELKCAF
jgi:hypothetical protein